MECSGNDQTGYSEGKQTSCCLGDDDVKVLFHAVDAAEEETHAHDEEQVGEHGADEGGLHDDHLFLDESDDGDD